MGWKLANGHGLCRLSGMLVVLLAGIWSQAGAVGTSTLFIYLEVPASYTVAAEISLAELKVAAHGRWTAVEPIRRHLAATELAGRQVLLARAEVTPAYYDSLNVVLGAATVQTGPATVKPSFSSQGESIPIEADLSGPRAAVITLVWQPAPVPAAGGDYVPGLHVSDRAVPPLGAMAFVTEPESGCVLAIDRLAGRVVGAIFIGRSPRGLAYSAQSQKLFVAEAAGDGIGVVDALTLRRERVVPLSFGDDPERLALSRDEATLYVLNPGSRSLVALATGSMQEKYRASVGDGPRSLAVDPVGDRVYVACELAGEVQVFGARGLGRQASLAGATSPVEAVFAARTQELFVTSGSQNRLQVFDLASGGSSGAQSLCAVGGYLAYSPRSRQLFVAVPGCQEVAVVRPADGFEFAPLAVGGEPGYLAFDPTYRQLLILTPESGQLAIAEANRGTLQHRVDVGGRPFAVLAP